MKERVIRELGEAIEQIQKSGQTPSQLMLDLQVLIGQPSESASPGLITAGLGQHVVDLNDPSLVPAIQRLLRCGQHEALRYVNIVKRGHSLALEMAAEQVNNIEDKG